MTATTTSVRPPQSAGVRLAWVAPVLVALVAVVLLVSVFTATPTRRKITVENHTGAYVTVRASNADGGSWLGLGTADPNGRSTFEAVSDQGGTWRFQLSTGPDQLTEIRRTADQLRAAGWRVVIPADTADRLPESRRNG